MSVTSVSKQAGYLQDHFCQCSPSKAEFQSSASVSWCGRKKTTSYCSGIRGINHLGAKLIGCIVPMTLFRLRTSRDILLLLGAVDTSTTASFVPRIFFFFFFLLVLHRVLQNMIVFFTDMPGNYSFGRLMPVFSTCLSWLKKLQRVRFIEKNSLFYNLNYVFKVTRKYSKR